MSERDCGPTRRSLLAGALAAAAAGSARAGTAEGEAVSDDDAIVPATVAAAERLLDVQFTAAERQQIVDSLGDQLSALRARRSFQPPLELPPASVFHPGLPGRDRVPAQGEVAYEAPGAPAPTDDEGLAWAPVTHLAHWLRTRQVTSQRLVEIALARLERLDPTLHHVVTPMPEPARAAAKQADDELDAGRWRGPLHGVPWGAKDLFDTAGVPTTFGATPFEGRVPEADAVVVERLAEAGAVLVAKLTTGALAYGDIWFGGKTRNPWNLEEGSSGSSAGPAAAVASGCVPFALGTETLGSIVSPSMRTGVTGLRPTFGRVPRTGTMPLCWSMDKIGPLARSAEDTVHVLAALHGAHPGDPSSTTAPLAYAPGSVEGLRVGYDPAWFEGEQAIDLDRAARDELGALGVELVEVSTPELPYEGLLLILLSEAAAAWEPITLDGRDDDLAWQDLEAWPNSFRLARFIPAIDLLQADRLRREVQRRFAELMSSVDALIAPSFAGPLLLATNCTGHPSLTLRVGFKQVKTRVWPPSEAERNPPGDELHRVPHGITLWGGLYDEGTLVRLGRALETAMGVAGERPPTR